MKIRILSQRKIVIANHVVIGLISFLIGFSSCYKRGTVENENTGDKVRMICRLMGKGTTETSSGKVWEGDLGVMFTHNGKVYLLTGDTGSSIGGMAQPGMDDRGVFAPNAIASTTDFDAGDCLDLNWSTNSDGSPKEFFPIIKPASTVPAGAISIDGVIYVFMMDVTHWGDRKDPTTHARPILIKSEDDGDTFSLVWTGETDGKFVNISPVISTHPLNTTRKVLFLMGSGKYRNSPIYLAFTELNSIGEKDEYFYFTGRDNNSPRWSMDENEAVPVIENVRVGELSVQWNSYLGKWLLSYFDYSDLGRGDMYFRTASNLWERWSEPELVFSGQKRYDWYETVKVYDSKAGSWVEKYWGGPYGGYLLQDLNREGGRIVYFTLSLWVPYSIFLMETDLSDIF